MNNTKEDILRIESRLSEDDYLTYQLYSASKKKSVKKVRTLSLLIPVAIFIFFGISSLLKNDTFIGILFCVTALLALIFYPYRDRKRYIKHYKKHINENYKNRIGKSVELEIDNEFIKMKEEGAEASISVKQIEEINEIPSAVYAKLKSGNSLIFSKENTTDYQRAINHLKQLSEILNIPYNREENWKWK